MKILVSIPGLAHTIPMNRFVPETFKEMGHNVFVFNHERENFFQKILEKTSRQSFIKQKNRKLLEAVEREKPDVFFAIYGTPLFAETIETIRKKGIKTICWWLNDPFELGTKKAPLSTYDLVISNSSFTHDMYTQAGVNHQFVPVGIFPKVHRPLDSPKMFDLLFAGDHSPVRETLLVDLIKKGMRPAIFGPWNKRAVKEYAVIKPFIIEKGFFTPEQMVEMFNASRIVINLHTWFGKFDYGVNPRLFEAAGCQSFQLADEKKEMQNLFDLKTELVTFQSLDEFSKLATYYLGAENEREQMAKAAFEKAMDCHTYTHRLSNLF